MDKAQKIRRLPRNPNDGDVVADKYGNLWEFSSNKNSWIDRGTISDPPDVTENQSGLVTPAIFKNLKHLRSVYESSPDQFQVLKLSPGTLAYWYYFRSADKLFKFTPDGESGLRIEIDRGRIFQILRKQVCPGAVGPRGDQGDQGDTGDGGAVEGCWIPSAVDGDRLDFAIFVPTPIDTPISVRVHRASSSTGIVAQKLNGSDHFTWWSTYLKKTGFTNPLGVVERQYQSLRTVWSARAEGMVKQVQSSLCDIELSEPLYGDIDQSTLLELIVDPAGIGDTVYIQPVSSLQLDQGRTNRSIRYDPLTRVLCGSLFLSSGTWGDSGSWCVKARQVGPDGDDGLDGQCMVSVVECSIADGPLLATCPVISLRADCEEEILYWLCSELLSERCVDRLQLAPGSATIAQDDAMLAMFGSAQVTTEQCKKIYRYKVELRQDDVPSLNLAHWDPQPGCVSKRNFDRHKFDWIPSTDLTACNVEGVRWFGPEALLPTKFPWPPIVEQAPDKDECCADDMFYCPNSQESGCPEIPDPIIIPPAGGTTTPTPPPTPPPSPPAQPPPPPPPTTVTCITLTVKSMSGSGAGEVVTTSITMSKIDAHYPYSVFGLEAGPAWRGQVMQPAWGSVTCSSTKPFPPSPPNIMVPVIYELFTQSSTGGKKKFVLVMSFPVCTTGDRNIATAQRQQSGQGSGDWNTSNFSWGIPSEKPWVNSIIHTELTDITQADFDNPIGKSLSSISSAQLFGSSGSATISACTGGGVVPPSPPPLLPSPPPPPPSTPDKYGCLDGKQPCGQILYTGVGNNGTGKVNTILIRDPLGDTILHSLTMSGKTVWRGCSMRTVPQAWVGATHNGVGGTLRSNVRVPIAYDLSCYPYPGGYGRPTPSPSTAYPTDGFHLRLFWPIRKAGELIPCASQVTPDITFGCATCIENGPCPPGSIQGDWFYPNFSAQVDKNVQVCSPRPVLIGFLLENVDTIFGGATQIVTLLEQDYTGTPVGAGGGVISHRLPEDWDVPIVRI